MSLFLDTSKIQDIEKYYNFGIISGVTTNPTIMYKNGIKGGIKGIKQHIKKIAELVAPYPVSVELLTNDKAKMMDQAIEFAGWASNIIVKVTIHGPDGELDNLEIIHNLEKKHNVHVNVTAMMSAQQCYLAAQAGATYVSLFCGRVNNMGYDSKEELTKIRYLLDNFKLKSKIIAASLREVINIVDWLISGAHIVTVVPEYLEKMIVHPYSKETVQMFLRDAEKIKL